MTIQRLLNISTHPGEPQRLFDNDWRQAEAFLDRWGFDGFELYPVGDYPCERIPARPGSFRLDSPEEYDYLLRCNGDLGDTARHIRTVHLTKSLSGDYIRDSQALVDPFNGAKTFWQRLDQARRHVARIDQHEAFETPAVAAVLEKIAPEHVVFEYTYKDMAEWERKIGVQKEALRGLLWDEGTR